MHNRRNQLAVKPRGKAQGKPVRRPPGKAQAFPAEVAIPPRSGASIKAVDVPPARQQPQPASTDGSVRVAAQPLFAMPQTAPTKRLRPAAKAKRRKPPKRQRKPRVAAANPAFALPVQAEPLVLPAPAATGQAIALRRPAGLAAQLQRWLAFRAEELWTRLAGLGPGPGAPNELSRLRAENARLRAQLEALLALRQPLGQADQIGAREGVPLPFP